MIIILNNANYQPLILLLTAHFRDNCCPSTRLFHPFHLARITGTMV